MTSPQWELFDLTGNPEHDLYDSHVCELTDIAGFPIQYFIRTSIETADTLYGEDQNATFSDGYETKIVYQPEEEINIISAFGFQPDDTIQYCYIPKNNFIRDISDYYDEDYLPMAGDIILTMWNNKKYEISHVGDEQNIFQGKKFVWEFTLRPYNYSEDSDSAEDIVNYESEDDFPEINDKGFDTKELSGYGENDWIEDESDEIYQNPDSSIYGY